MNKNRPGFSKKEDWVHLVVPSTAFEADSLKKELNMTPAQHKSMLTTSERMRKHLNKWQGKERRINYSIINN